MKYKAVVNWPSEIAGRAYYITEDVFDTRSDAAEFCRRMERGAKSTEILPWENQPKEVSEPCLTQTPSSSPKDQACDAAPSVQSGRAANITSDQLDRALTIQLIMRRKMALGDKNCEVTEEEIRQEATNSQLTALTAENAKLTRERDEFEHYCDQRFCPSCGGLIYRERMHDEIAVVYNRVLAERDQLRAERDEWRCSALLYHSELRDLTAGKKVETQLGFEVQKVIADLHAQLATLRAAMAVKDAALTHAGISIHLAHWPQSYPNYIRHALDATPANDLLARIEDAAKALEAVANWCWSMQDIEKAIAGLQPWRPKA